MTGYDATRAAAYWGASRHEGADELAAVLSLGEPAHVNAAYDAWEAGVLGDGSPADLGRKMLHEPETDGDRERAVPER